MSDEKNTLELRIERTIQASPEEVYKSWMNSKVKGTPWHAADKLIISFKKDGLFYCLANATPHYGRFTRIEPSRLVQHTWISPYTEGRESVVTVSFKKIGGDTRFVLVHSDLPNSAKGRAHEAGWAHVIEEFPNRFRRKNQKKSKK